MTANKKIDLIIASYSFIQRLGIKTILSVMGIDCTIIEIDNPESLLSLQKSIIQQIDFIILSEDIIDEKNKISDIEAVYKHAKVLIIGSQKFDMIENFYYLDLKESQSKSVKILEQFFTKENQKQNNIESSILSSREIEILKLIAQGYSNKKIADYLFISINTVITHRKNITEKLDIKTIAGLTVYAIMNNYIDPQNIN